jgi:O-antigen/teichoic acid export membrane protein
MADGWPTAPGRPPINRGVRPNPPLEDDSAFAARQLNGLLALLALAEPETTMVPFSGPMVQLRYSSTFNRVDSPLRPEYPGPAGTAGRGSAIWTFVRTDPMLRNALFLVLNAGLQAGLGFAFWIIAARFFSTDNVGRASSLISATNLIAFLGIFGMNTTFVRYLPIAQNRNRLLTAGLSLVGLGGSAVALIYVLLMPLVFHPISFVAHSIPLAAGFIFLSAGAAVNLLTDAAFIAAGKSQYNALVDGVIGGGSKVILIFIFAGSGSFALFTAATGGLLIAAVASLLLMVKVLHWRPQFGNFAQELKPVLKFSGNNYASSILNLLPILIVPLIVLDRISASTEAYYFVSYQLATLLYQAVYSVEASFLSEGANTDGLNKAVLKRSLRILLCICIPAFIVIVLFGHDLLGAFGSKYASNAAGTLIPLAAAVFPIAAFNWSMTILRLLTKKLGVIVWGNAITCVVVLVLAWVLAPHGLVAVATAWPIGTTIGAVILGIPAVTALRRSLYSPAQPAVTAPGYRR